MGNQLAKGQPVARLHVCSKHPEKIQYRSIGDAFDTADRRSEAEQVRIRVYACDVCGYFHLSKKAGTENLGHELAGRADGLIWETATPPGMAVPMRDERYLSNDRAARERAQRDAVRFRSALAAHGNPVKVTGGDIGRWLQIPNSGARALLAHQGWVMVGVRAAAKWYHPDHVPPEPAPEPEPGTGDSGKSAGAARVAQPAPTRPRIPAAPPPVPQASGWETVPTMQLGNVRLGDVIAAYQAIGIRVELRILRPKS